MRTIGALLISPFALTFRADLGVGVAFLAMLAIVMVALRHWRTYSVTLGAAAAVLAYWWSMSIPHYDPMGQNLFIQQRIGATVIFAFVSLAGFLTGLRNRRSVPVREIIE